MSSSIGEAKPDLQMAFQQNLTLDDWGLTVRGPTSHEEFLTLESKQLSI